MPWGVAAALAGAITSLRATHERRVAELRAQGRDTEADLEEAAWRARMESTARVVRDHELLAGRGGPFVRTRIRVHLPLPALVYEAPWWPWLIVEIWMHMWVMA